MKRIFRNAVECKECLDIVVSRSRHDYRTCVCKAVSVDGGDDYGRRVGDLTKMTEVTVTVDYGDEET